MVNPWQSKRILWAGLVQAGVVYSHAPLVILLQDQNWVGKPFWKEHFHDEAGCKQPALSPNPKDCDAQGSFQPAKETKKIPLVPEHPERFAVIGANLDSK